MRHTNFKTIVLLLGFILSATWCVANGIFSSDGNSNVPIKESHVQGTPKGSSIQAFIFGHYLMVSFIENLGRVIVDVTTSTGGLVETESILTPDGLQIYIPLAGDYIVTIKLPNGDEYYGEFTVTD